MLFTTYLQLLVTLGRPVPFVQRWCVIKLPMAAALSTGNSSTVRRLLTIEATEAFVTMQKLFTTHFSFEWCLQTVASWCQSSVVTLNHGFSKVRRNLSKVSRETRATTTCSYSCFVFALPQLKHRLQMSFKWLKLFYRFFPELQWNNRFAVLLGSFWVLFRFWCLRLFGVVDWPGLLDESK